MLPESHNNSVNAMAALRILPPTKLIKINLKKS